MELAETDLDSFIRNNLTLNPSTSTSITSPFTPIQQKLFILLQLSHCLKYLHELVRIH